MTYRRPRFLSDTHNEEKQTDTSERFRPHRLRLMLMRYGLLSVVVLMVEAALVGRALFLAPLSVGLAVFVFGRRDGMRKVVNRWIMWVCAALAVLLGIAAAFDWWWPVYWYYGDGVHLRAFRMLVPVRVGQTWLMLRLFAIAFMPLVVVIPTALAGIRYVLEIIDSRNG